jgi:cob(I)alamin adenosyltransferase
MVKLNKIYTRTGDDGTTGLVDGSRRAKHDPRMIAIGEVDEANSAIGLAAVAAPEATARDLHRIQNDLFDLGADLATPGEDFTPSEMVLRIVPAQVAWLEQAIDVLNESLPPLTSFILPGGSEAAARVHVRARSRGARSGPGWRWRRKSRSTRPRWPISTACRTICSCWPARSTPAPIRCGCRARTAPHGVHGRCQ